MTLRPVLLAFALLSLGGPAIAAPSSALLDRRLAECGSLRPFARYEVADGFKVRITLPSDIYPSTTLEEAQHGATFSWISHGPSQTHTGKNCSTTVGVFAEITRCITRVACGYSVDLRSKSAVAGIPDFKATFVVLPL